MPQIELAGTMLEIDEQGYLQESNRWNEDIAQAYAVKEGVGELTPG
jgi:sulfur relay (sulfurtransferase) DsrC/TusE family protein